MGGGWTSPSSQETQSCGFAFSTPAQTLQDGQIREPFPCGDSKTLPSPCKHPFAPSTGQLITSEVHAMRLGDRQTDRQDVHRQVHHKVNTKKPNAPNPLGQTGDRTSPFSQFLPLSRDWGWGKSKPALCPVSCGEGCCYQLKTSIPKPAQPGAQTCWSCTRSCPGPARSKYFQIPPGDAKKSPLSWEGRTGSSSSSLPRKDQCSLQPSRLMLSGLELGCTPSSQTQHLQKNPSTTKKPLNPKQGRPAVPPLSPTTRAEFPQQTDGEVSFAIGKRCLTSSPTIMG